MVVLGPWLAASDGVAATAWDAESASPQDEARFADYARWRAFHAGDQWPHPPRRGEPPRLVLNYARALIRKSASYIFSGPVGVSVQSGAEDRDTANAAERRLTDLRTTLGLDALDVSLAVESMAIGDAAMKVTWDDVASRPRVVPVDPASLVVRTAADDPRVITELRQGYAMTGAELRTLWPVSARSLDAEARYPVIERWTADAWQTQIAGHMVRDGRNPYGWIPYVLVPNDPAPTSCWGQSDLADLVPVCRELNQRMTVLSHVLELSGAPIAVLENVDGSEGIRVGPGAKWELPEGSRAYLLDLLQGGGAELHLKYIDVLFRSLYDLSETPRTAFGDGGRDLSGAALEVEIQPLLQRVQRKRRIWDAVHAKRNAMLLDVLERFGHESFGGLRATSTIWPPVLPSDRAAAVQNAVALVGSGIQSRRAAMVSLGESDPDAELARLAEESSSS